MKALIAMLIVLSSVSAFAEGEVKGEIDCKAKVDSHSEELNVVPTVPAVTPAAPVNPVG